MSNLKNNIEMVSPQHSTEKDLHRNNGNTHNEFSDSEDALRQIRTAGTITLTPEMFEKLYLSPETKVKGDLRKTFANPTPLAIIGFLISLSPLACQLMGWRNSSGPAPGASGTPMYLFFGGMLEIIAAVGEWLLGNTFPFVVFGSFGAFWLAFGANFQPFYNSWGAYSPDPANPGLGLQTESYNSSFAFYCVAMSLMCLVYLVCSLRTNVAFVVIFFTLVLAFGCFAGIYWNAAAGNAALAGRLQTTAGALLLVTSASGWWIFVSIMLATLDFPFQLPVGDLSNFIRSGSERRKLKGEQAV